MKKSVEEEGRLTFLFVFTTLRKTGRVARVVDWAGHKIGRLSQDR